MGLIPPVNRWGSFAADADEPERRAQLPAMRAITRLCCDSRGNRLADELRRAEHDAVRLGIAP